MSVSVGIFLDADYASEKNDGKILEAVSVNVFATRHRYGVTTKIYLILEGFQ